MNFMDLSKTFDDAPAEAALKEESVRVAWNYQKNVLHDQYNNILHKLQEEQLNMRQKVLKFERLSKDGNLLIKFNEMNAEALMGKLLIIEDDPRVIWEALLSTYG